MARVKQQNSTPALPQQVADVPEAPPPPPAPPPGHITLDAFMGPWLVAKTAALSETSRAGYQYRAKKILAGLGHVYLDELTAFDIETWQGELGLSAASTAECRRTMASVLRDATAQLGLRQDFGLTVTKGPKPPQGPKAAPHIQVAMRLTVLGKALQKVEAVTAKWSRENVLVEHALDSLQKGKEALAAAANGLAVLPADFSPVPPKAPKAKVQKAPGGGDLQAGMTVMIVDRAKRHYDGVLSSDEQQNLKVVAIHGGRLLALETPGGSKVFIQRGHVCQAPAVAAA